MDPWQEEQRAHYVDFLGGSRFMYERVTVPVVWPATPSRAKQLLTSTDWSGKTGKLAIEFVELQLKLYRENLKAELAAEDSDQNNLVSSSEDKLEAQSKSEDTAQATAYNPNQRLTSLFDATAQKIGRVMERDPDTTVMLSGLNTPSVSRAFWRWSNIPYATFCAVQARSTGNTGSGVELERVVTRSKEIKGNSEGPYDRDIDLWILRNEEWLRKQMRMRTSTLSSSDVQDQWNHGLVTLDECEAVFAGSHLTEEYRKITRPVKMDGYICLDAKRSPYIYIQPNDEKFRTKLEEMTHGQLEGLDWSNVFIAGGIVLGSLLSIGHNTEDKDGFKGGNLSSGSMWEKSDIDIYLYGLNPVEANKKIEHLFHIFESNIPQDAKDSILVVKNSRTITFLASYPHRRFQIILKLVKNPAEVLLNFDLDICAAGYDGKRVYMLPRAARALQTGYNVFTMDMVQGHYLGERRASQEQRVFKYANKGYGIRFLPNYIDTFNKHLTEEKRASHKVSSMDEIVASSRDYFDRMFKTYMKWTDNGRTLQRHYVGSYGLHVFRDPSAPSPNGVPGFTHALLDTEYQKSTEPLRRSCLTGFGLFMRHVALWEAEQDGRLYIQDDVWASTTYDDALYGISYEDLPSYPWDQTFSSANFLQRINQFNSTQAKALEDYARLLQNPPSVNLLGVRRIVAGKALSDVFSSDLYIPIWMPRDFVVYTNHLVQTVAKDHPGLRITNVLEEIVWEGKRQKQGGRSFHAFNGKYDENLVIVRFKLSPVMMYQQLDRRLDELYEVIWSFMHAYNNSIYQSDEGLCRVLRRQLSHRSLRSRKKAEEEMKDFIAWVTRDPGGIAGGNYGPIGQGFWDDFEMEGENNVNQDDNGNASTGGNGGGNVHIHPGNPVNYPSILSPLSTPGPANSNLNMPFHSSGLQRTLVGVGGPSLLMRYAGPGPAPMVPSMISSMIPSVTPSMIPVVNPSTSLPMNLHTNTRMMPQVAPMPNILLQPDRRMNMGSFLQGQRLTGVIPPIQLQPGLREDDSSSILPRPQTENDDAGHDLN